MNRMKIPLRDVRLLIIGWRISKIPDNLGYDEIVISKGLARKYSLHDGDTIEITFRAEGFMPSVKKLTVRSIALTDYENSVGTTLVISEALFKELYKDIPSNIYLDCSDPETVGAVIKNHSADRITEIQTYEEAIESTKQGSASIMIIIDAVIMLALGITFIGVVSNCLIGFEGRKRECAVLMSTALKRGRLSKMFLAESAFASGAALITAVPLSMFMYRIFMNLLDGLMITIPIHMNIGSSLLLGLLMWIVFTLSALFPIKALRKMNIAAQLKYE